MLLLVSKRKNKHLFYAIGYLKQILCVYCNAISIYPKFYYKCIYETYWTFVEVRNSIKAEIWTISNNRTTNCQNKMKERRTVRKKNMPDEKKCKILFLFYIERYQCRATYKKLHKNWMELITRIPYLLLQMKI